jgi:hypothetical protein
LKINFLEHAKSYVISSRTSLWEAIEKLIEFKQERFLIVEREGDVQLQTHPEPYIEGSTSSLIFLPYF